MAVNAPWAFTAIWTLVKGWLDEKTRAKVSIVGARYTPKLLEYIDKE